MAINTKKKLPKEDNDSNKEMMKYVRAALAILLLLLLFLAFFFGLWGARRVLFEENKYLTLRKLEVIGTGYWNGREAFLAKMLKLNVGSDNLFKLNYPVLRKRLLDIPSINDARIVRVLPDTLLLHVEERVPRLILANPNSPWVIDENCIAIPKAESMATNQKLPVMTGVKLDLISGGMKLTQLRPAVDLVMMTLRNFPNLQILAIRFIGSRRDKMRVVLQYRNKKVCMAIIPIKNQGLDVLLHALQSAIVSAQISQDYRTNFDLSYDGQVVIY